MFEDPPRSLYLLLIVAAIVTGGVAAKYQTRKTFVIFLAAAGLLLALFLADTFVESPREEATRRVQAMAVAAEAAKVEEFNAHISTQAKLSQPIPWHLIRDHKPRITVWDFSRDDYQELKGDRILIGFMAKGEAPGGIVLKYAKAIFAREADGTYKLESVEFFNPATKQPEPLPGM